VSVVSPCFTIGPPNSDNCNWLMIYSSICEVRYGRKGSTPFSYSPALVS
jgi:hypothetical protein